MVQNCDLLKFAALFGRTPRTCLRPALWINHDRISMTRRHQRQRRVNIRSYQSVSRASAAAAVALADQVRF